MGVDFFTAFLGVAFLTAGFFLGVVAFFFFGVVAFLGAAFLTAVFLAAGFLAAGWFLKPPLSAERPHTDQ